MSFASLSAAGNRSTTASSTAMTVSLLHSHHVPPLEPPPRKAPLPALLLPTPLLPALLPATTAAAAATGSWRWYERAYSSSPPALTSLRVHHHRAQLVLH